MVKTVFGFEEEDVEDDCDCDDCEDCEDE